MVNMDDFQRDFIENLKSIRTQRNVTQAQLAEMCGVSTGTIGNIECGLAKPSFDLIIAISRNLATHPALLFSTSALIPEHYLKEHSILEDFYAVLRREFSDAADESAENGRQSENQRESFLSQKK